MQTHNYKATVSSERHIQSFHSSRDMNVQWQTNGAVTPTEGCAFFWTRIESVHQK